MQIIYTLPQTDHASISSLIFLQAGCSSWRQTKSVKALNNYYVQVTTIFICWHLTRVNGCVSTWLTLMETRDMLNMTTSPWTQPEKTIDLLHLEHTAEMQVGEMWVWMNCLQWRQHSGLSGSTRRIPYNFYIAFLTAWNFRHIKIILRR